MKKDKETIDEIMRLREEGKKVQEIADHFGVSKERIYQIAGDELKAWQAERNAKMPEPPKRKIDIRTVQRLLGEGKSLKEVADEMGCSRQTIYNKLKALERDSTIFGVGGIALSQDPRAIANRIVDPETGIVVDTSNNKAIGRMGDEKVTRFVQYHMECFAMRQGCDKKNVEDLYRRFFRYLQYCQEKGVIPGNMNAYLAIGITANDISKWKSGAAGTPEHKKFANDITSFFASVHEQGAVDGVLNPISAMFWQKAHDHLIEANKLEVVTEDPLGEKRSATEIAKTYSEVELPD